MPKIYYEKDSDLGLISGKTIGIIGYGSQGHAHAQNLRDSGCRVLVASKPNGNGWKAAKSDGFEVVNAAEVAKTADIIMMLAPDTLQSQIYHESIEA